MLNEEWRHMHINPIESLQDVEVDMCRFEHKYSDHTATVGEHVSDNEPNDMLVNINPLGLYDNPIQN